MPRRSDAGKDRQVPGFTSTAYDENGLDNHLLLVDLDQHRSQLPSENAHIEEQPVSALMSRSVMPSEG